MKNKNTNLTNLLLSAMFLAIGLVLPFITGQIQQIGNMLLPMHIPVLLCGLICGWQYGLTVGLILPVMRSFLFTMPVLYPSAIAMSLELGTYGLIVGLLFGFAKYKCIRSLYRCLLISMISGRIVWGLAMLVLMGAKGNLFTFEAFLGGAFLNAIPGIVVQLILIPALMLALSRTHFRILDKHKHKGERSHAE
ncbi:MAG: ECF transporter S component [Ruminococcaceae bacterium]|nr:ECF transporter S component [Oscillospiraceae bacterium]